MADTAAGATGATRAADAQTRNIRFAGNRAVKIGFSRGVYDVASLCYLFSSLGYQVDNAKWEASIEGDGSAVPGMLAGVLYDLGDAIIAMAQEEIAEALAGYDLEAEVVEGDEELEDGERAHVRAATVPTVRAFRRAMAQVKLRAGKTLSSETVRCLREARDLHDEAMDLHRSAIRKHKDGLSAIDTLLERSGASDPEDTDNQSVQASDGTDDSEGSANDRAVSADYRRRQIDLLALSANA